MIFLNIKIIRVIYPTADHTARLQRLGTVATTRKSSAENKGYIGLAAKIN